MNILGIETRPVEKAKQNIEDFQKDPDAMKCLELYRQLPPTKQSVLMLVLDAFLTGVKVGRGENIQN